MSSGSVPSPTVLVLTSGGFNPNMLINGLFRSFPGLRVVEEQPESKSVLLKRRIRRFGYVNAAGQLATMVLSRFGKRFAEDRIQAIAREHGLSGERDPRVPVDHVESLNDAAAHALVARLKPAVVVTVSCRILSKATLAAIPCPVINLHSAINPAYRGQMGGYWALVSGDRDNFGSTIHLVDEGVDTGAVLHQVRTTPARGDSMWTYPALLTAISVDPMRQAVEDAIHGTLKPTQATGPSHLWFNVPIWTWLYHGLTKGIW
ncbi:formyl transferase [Gellertiella hungarica]|uniref:phosphoribosylglycinamide formyltransferase 1 n=1 Tax=Gellertiella hungarica TaxID=1572859 RepID=A0A7W6J8U6_9HYPH|nr:formyl transferase [Gellertiella hungarica]MBB4066919.1 folate-dependent phosphoribosylglycinamide formyltransferase PurN [Gellertiella hungarica]